MAHKQPSSRRQHGGGSIVNAFLRLSAVPDTDHAPRIAPRPREQPVPSARAGPGSNVRSHHNPQRGPPGAQTALAVQALTSAPKQKAVPGLPCTQNSALVRDTVETAMREYQGQYGHAGPVADGPALEALIAQQRDGDERAKAKRRRAAEAAERKALQARKDAQAAAAVPSGFRQDQTADALEHVLSRGSLLGVGFNPEAALRGNRGWPIVARMARVADVEAVSAKLYSEVMDELVVELCSTEHSAATQQLEQQVEALLKEAYPVTASLPKSELRKRLKEARALEEQKYRSSRNGGREGMDLPPDENHASGVFGRQLSLVRRAHQLIVADFNAELGLRTRSAAQASLLQGNSKDYKTRAELAIEGDNRNSGRSSRSAHLPQTSSSSAVKGHTIFGNLGRHNGSSSSSSGGDGSDSTNNRGAAVLPRPSAEAAANMAMASERPSSSLWSSSGNSSRWDCSSSGVGIVNESVANSANSSRTSSGSQHVAMLRARRPRQRSTLATSGSQTISSTLPSSLSPSSGRGDGSGVSSPVIMWGKPTKRRSHTATDDDEDDDEDDDDEDSSNSIDTPSKGGRVMRPRREREVITAQDGALRSIERARELENTRALKKRQSNLNSEQIAPQMGTSAKSAFSPVRASNQRNVRDGLQYCTLEEEEEEEEDALMESGEGTALVIGVISPTGISQAADIASTGDSSRRGKKASSGEHSPRSPQGDDHNYRDQSNDGRGNRRDNRANEASSSHISSSSSSSSSPPGVAATTSTNELWARAAAAAEALGMADLRRCLVNRKLDPQTHGVVGAPRHFALKQKLLQAVATSATIAEDTWATEHATFLGHELSTNYSSSNSGRTNVVAAAASRQWHGDGKLQLEAFVANPMWPPLQPPSHAAPSWLSAISLPKNKDAVAARAKAEAFDRALDSGSDSD